MKRFIAMALILMMCLGMTACGATEDEKAFEEANALLEAGDYEGGIGEVLLHWSVQSDR